MSSHIGLNSDASRPKSKSGILTPSSDCSLNSSSKTLFRDAPVSFSGKRRHDGSVLPPTEDLLEPTIVIKPHPSTIHVKPSILHPLMLLPREHLPLSALDLHTPHGDFSASRFYESNIKILDLEGRLGSNILLARSETRRAVYAIERQDDGLYTLCKLGPWVDVRMIARHATLKCHQRLRSAKEPLAQPNPSQVPLVTPQIHKDNKRRRLAIEEIQSLVKKRARSQSVATVLSTEQSQLVLPEANSPAMQSPRAEHFSESKTPAPQLMTQATPQPDLVETTLSQPTAEVIFENIRNSYVETLYHSMGSLAYFAKGPLSRARAAFHLDCESNLDMNDLIDFLKDLAMTTVVIDKKYRETMPEIIAKMKTLVEDSDNDGTKFKKRKTKKMKLGKDGLYAHEATHICRWWRANEPPIAEDGKPVTQNEVKYHISCLRRRETQLQMIIIMEILALEPLRRPREDVEDSQLPGMESQRAASQTAAEPPVKKRNKHNFPVLLDVHADRLCIWQSTIPDEVKALTESQHNSHAQAADKSANSDPLKDFCVDVILPFFSARLPDVCDSINRKLGGPVIKPPPKPTQTKPPSQPKARPGAPFKKQPSSRRDREKTLERVLSNERLRRSVSRGPSSALAHMRSASATTIPGLKREASEPLMGMIPKRELPPPLTSRSSNLFSRSSSFTSLPTEDQKAKKQARLDAELKEAITALKRPNRAMAGKEIVEETETRRASTSLSSLKKARKPVRDPAFGRSPAVQVKATPANNRFKDVIAAERESKAQLMMMVQEDEVVKDEEMIPASSSCVPSSAAPERVLGGGFSFSSPADGATPLVGRGLVQATPVRMEQPPLVAEGNLPSSPVLARKAVARRQSAQFSVTSNSGLGGVPAATAGIFETPLKPRSAMDDMRTPIRPLRLGPGSAAVVATPEMKRTASAVIATPEMIKTVDTTQKQQAEEERKEGRPAVSIYQQMGWDDDYDLD